MQLCDSDSKQHVISEGKATVKTAGNVFYNPVQEFNRDLSISVLNVLSQQESRDKPDGIVILEAFSATGLRSIRYAKEVAGVRQILANDISKNAVANIERNVTDNEVQDVVTATESDATMLMYGHRDRAKQFDVIDLDPYGCPSRFLEAAVQSIRDGGLLLVTATDMAVLAGNSPETCYSKYGAVSLRIKSCHEMALRILLQTVESHANRYGRYIEPVLSISADFYIRIFVKIFTSPQKCKHTLSKLSQVYQCMGCDTFTLQPLGVVLNVEVKGKMQTKFKLPSGPPVGSKCEHCGHSHHVGGPIWSGPLHDFDFVKTVYETAPEHLGTYKRIRGVLSVVLEELIDCPLYYTLDKLSGVLHVQSIPMLPIRSALLNAGYRVSLTHANKMSIKTDAPSRAVWDIMRCWEALHPVSEKRRDETGPGTAILSVPPEKQYLFERHPDANPSSRQQGCVRFQANPTPFWGPGTRSTTMIVDEKVSKKHLNQGKRKRIDSEEPAKAGDN